MVKDNPYPTTKPRLRSAWEKGYTATASPHSFANPYRWGTPCRAAFQAGYEWRETFG